MSLQIVSPFQQFFDRDGSPLDNGFVYVGVANLNPETNPLTIYYDDALTIPAAQPLRTLNGYIVRNGSPARLYTSQEDFSLTVRDKSGVLVLTVFDATSASNISTQFAQFVSNLASASGSSLVGYNQGGANAVDRTVQSRLRETVFVKDFGAVGNGVTDDTTAFQNAVAAVGRGMLETDDRSYVVGDVALDNTSLRGYGELIAASGASAVLSLERDDQFGWRHRLLEGMTINGNSKASNGVTFGEGGDDEVAGRWTIDTAFIHSCDKCIVKPTGNIGNLIRSTSMRNSNFGYHSTGQSSPVMHGGSDIIQSGEIAGMSLAAVYINSPQDGTGQFLMDGTVIENNDGFGIFVKSFGVNGNQDVPLRLRDVWFEDNARVASVTIDGVSYTPRDMYFEDAKNVIVEGSQLRDIEIKNANVIFDNCSGNDLTDFVVDTNSRVILRNLFSDAMRGQQVMVESLAHARRPSGAFATTLWCAPRATAIKTLPYGSVGIAQDFDGAVAFNMGGTSTITSTQVTDSLLFDNCAEFTQPAGNTNVFGTMTMTSGKWYAYTIDFKQVSGTIPDIDIVQGTSIARDLNLCAGPAGEWRTLGGVCRANVTGTTQFRFVNGSVSNSVFRISALQIIEFDYEQQALDYFNNRFALVA